MKRITFLFMLLFLTVCGANAQTKVPSSTLLTYTELQAATDDVYLGIKCISGTNSYWFCGNKSVADNTNQECVFVWEAAGDGTHYLKKYAPTSAQGEGYLQAGANNSNLSWGAKSSAQKLNAITATLPGGSDLPVSGTNTDEGYIVRFAEASGNAYWINVQTPTGTPKYNTGQGLFTMFNIYQMEDVVENTVGEALITGNDLRAGYKYLVRNISSSRGGYVYVDSDNSLKVASGTANLLGEAYIFTAEAAEGGVYLKASNNQYIPATAGDGTNLSTSETPAVVTVAHKGGSYPLTTLNLMVNGVYCNANPGTMCCWNQPDDANGVWEIIPVNADNFINATISGTLNTTLGAEVDMGNIGTGNYLPDQEAIAPSFNYMTATGTIVVNSETGTKVTYQEKLPFVPSTSVESGKWYLVHMRSNNGYYMWTAATSDFNDSEVVPTSYAAQESSMPADTRLWCFIGDAFNGFKIYNKAAGSGFTLNKPATGNTPAKLSSAEATVYSLAPSTQNVTNGTCFLAKGDTYYINMQTPSGYSNFVLRGWNVADGGSSCLFYNPDSLMIKYAENITVLPANALGTPTFFNEDGAYYQQLPTALANCRSDHQNLTYTEALSDVLAEYVSSPTNPTEITDGGLYRILNRTRSTVLDGTNQYTRPATYGGFLNYAPDNTTATVCAYQEEATVRNTSDVNAIWKLTLSGTDYTLQNPNSGKYLAATSSTGDSQYLTMSDTPAGYTISHISNGQFTLTYNTETGYNRMLMINMGVKNGTNPSPADTEFAWYIIPATSLDMTLNAAGDNTWASTYLPFDITLPDNVKAYYATTLNSEKTQITLTNAENVPARNGVILMGADASVTNAKLNIATADATLTGNKLEGTLTKMEEIFTDLYYTLGAVAGNVGLYHPSSNTLKANKAYLPKTAINGSEGVQGLIFSFDGVTGINSVNARNEGNADTFYDLTGRRISKPAKGLYIQNGCKVYIR